MIKPMLRSSFKCDKEPVGLERLNQLSALASQISKIERESLYVYARDVYTGEGGIWDIGCAAGGSSFCLAAGLQDNPKVTVNNPVKCFDLFAGYSVASFESKFPGMNSDIEIFSAQTYPVKDYVEPVKMNIVKELVGFEMNDKIEFAHIDAAKSLILWKSIFERLSASVIPGRTIWVFQDFERARLPWQVYSVAELLPFGDIIGGAPYGTIYFKFNSAITEDSRKKIIEDRFSIEEKVDNVNRIFSLMRACLSEIFPIEKMDIDDVENTMLAYCHYWNGNVSEAEKILKNTTNQYLSIPANKIYSREIFRDYDIR